MFFVVESFIKHSLTHLTGSSVLVFDRIDVIRPTKVYPKEEGVGGRPNLLGPKPHFTMTPKRRNYRKVPSRINYER